MAYLNRLTLIDANGNVFDSIADVRGDYHLGVACIQDINQDPNNTSVANLASGATFTGTMTSIPGVGVINVVLKADQDCTVYVDQTGDGTNYDITDTYYYVANTGEFGVPVQVVGQSYRVRVTNTGPNTTTVFRLEVQLTPVGSPLPRSLDAYQNLKVGVNALKDQYGYLGQFDAARMLSVEQPYRLVGVPFIGTTTDTNFWTTAHSGAGSVADTGATTLGVATLVSGTVNSGYGSLQSVRVSRFVFGNQVRFRGLICVPTVVEANSTRAWGAVTLSTVAPQDGFFFSLSGAGVLSVNWAYNGSVTSVASGSFNGLVSKYTVDTNVHVYEIQYFMASAQFFIDGVLIHSIVPSTAQLVSTFHLPVSAWSANSASGTTSATLQVFASTIHRLGQVDTATKSYYSAAISAGTVLKYGPGLVHDIIIGSPTAGYTITLYDNTAGNGTVLWASGTISSGGNPSPFALHFGSMPFYTGLTLVSTGTSSFTVMYE